MIDPLGRNVNKLRVSVGEMCNFSCIYCVKDVGGHHVAPDPLTMDQRVVLIGLLKEHTGIEKVRITGGEPLLFKDLPLLIQGIVDQGISNIGLTTNGHFLAKQAKALKAAGLQSANVSLDSVNTMAFRGLARAGTLQKVLHGIEAALDAGIKIKINTVVIRGQNDHELVDILNYAFPLGIEVRFLELMKMGPLFEGSGACSEATPDHAVPMKEMLETIGAQFSFRRCSAEADSTALRFQTFQGTFGIIANESAPFCGSCSRMRLTSTGNLVGCLSNPTEIPVRHLLDVDDPEAELRKLYRDAMAQKRTHAFTGSALGMSSIGG